MDTYPRAARALALAAVTLLAGCAGFSRDGGFAGVSDAVRPHLRQEPAWPRDDAARAAVDARVAALLARPLAADDAVQIALLNNPGLRAAYESLAIAEASRVAAGRLPNPGVSLARLARGGEIEWERALHLDLARLLARPLAAEVEQRRFETTQRALALETLRLANDARGAWVTAVAAEQVAAYRAQAVEVTGAGAELARRLAEVGNWSRRKQAREQSLYADAALAEARARQAASQARERLVRLLGLADGAALRLPDRLPDLPVTLPPQPDIEQQAMDSRVDLAIVRMQAEALAANLGLARRTRFVNVLEAGVMDNDSNRAPDQRGYEIRFELPLFDWGEARVRGAEARYRQALERGRATALAARSEVREAAARRQDHHAIARHYRDEIVPLRKRLADEALLRYNGMLIGPFELLVEARAQIDAVASALDAERDFWLADAGLRFALAGPPAATLPDTPAAAAPVAAGGH